MNNISIFVGSRSKSHILMEFGTLYYSDFYCDLLFSCRFIDWLKASPWINWFLCSFLVVFSSIYSGRCARELSCEYLASRDLSLSDCCEVWLFSEWWQILPNCFYIEELDTVSESSPLLTYGVSRCNNCLLAHGRKIRGASLITRQAITWIFIPPYQKMKENMPKYSHYAN